MFDSRSVSVQRSSAVLRNVSGNAPTACTHRTPNDAERVFQCQGDESLAAELIISITHGRVAQTPPVPPPRPHPLGFHHKCQPVWQWPPEWVGGEHVGRWEQWKREMAEVGTVETHTGKVKNFDVWGPLAGRL